MRPQQNRRMRGRGNNGNNNRKGPNPLTRSYESNGPDVKIRGSAQQIAEKYTTLARDAQSAGDRVMAENYLQHAEHYNRIIMAAQAQMPMQHQARDMRDDDDDMDDDGDEGFTPAVATEPVQPQQQRANGSGPQPVIEGTPAEVALKQGSIGQRPQRQPAESAEPAEAVAEPAEAAAPVEAAEPAAEEGAAPRRARRPRRPRVKAADAGSGDDQPGAGSDEPVTEAAQ